MKFSISSFEPQAKKPCLCGSGLAFKRCCKSGYREGPSYNVRARLNDKQFQLALKECRQHFVWYALCHRAHTVPFLESESDQARHILTVDIRALAEILDLLKFCYVKTGMIGEFNKVVNAATELIDDQRWRDKISRVSALWWMLEKSDRKNAKNAISAVEIEKCKDPEVISTFLDLNAETLSFDEKNNLFDRICEHSDDEAYVLQYGCAKGVEYFKICEYENAVNFIDTAIKRYRSLPDDSKNQYGDHQYAHSLQLLGLIKNDKTVVEQAAGQFRTLLEDATKLNLTDFVIAEYRRALAECERNLGNIESAIHYLRESLTLNPSLLTKVFLSQAHLQNGSVESARKILNEIDPNEFENRANQYDFAIALTELALFSQDVDDIEIAKNQIRICPVSDPYFTQRSQQSLIQLLETATTSSNSSLKRLAKAINRCVTLNPNFFGIGININRIVDELL